MMDVPDACFSIAAFQGLRPDSDESLADWCDTHIELPQGRHAEAGRWRTSRTPFLREIMERLSPSDPTDEVVVMKGAQLGLTQTAVHWCGYVMTCAPAPILFVEPTTDVAKKVSKQRIQPMLDNTPALHGLVRASRSRDSGNTMLQKEFIGGDLVITGANSGVGLRFMTARYLVLDEEDGYPPDVDGEGPPSELAKNRLATFARSKTLRMSTPLDASTSVIEPAYNAGSRGRYHVPCPLCLKAQPLDWSGIVFTFDGEKDLDRTSYRCAYCYTLIAEHHKTFMLGAGHWVHEDPANPIKSYHLSTLYAPYGWIKSSWASLAKEWIFASRTAKAGDTRYLKKFLNTKLAQTFQDIGEKVASHAIMQRRETYAAPCPDGVLVITAAVDVQDDRLEAEKMGWGIGEESWSLGYKQCFGKPSQQAVWDACAAWLQEPLTHESGISMSVQNVLVDTGGHHTQEAYEFVKRYRGGRICAGKGSSTMGDPVVPARPSKQKKSRLYLYLIGTVAAKDTLFPRMQIDTFGPGYLHFPDYPEYDKEYFEQLTSEEKKLKYTKGILMGRSYSKTRTRNEALDLKVYNLAALKILNPNLERLAARMQRVIEHVKPTRDLDAIEPPTPDLAPPAAPLSTQRAHRLRFSKPRRTNFVKGWR